MKKLISVIIALSLTCAILLSGCSCSSDPKLTFTVGKCGSEKLGVGYKESLTYSVKYEEDFNESLAKSKNISSNVLSCTILGTYTSDFEILGTYPVNNPDIPSSSLYDDSCKDFVCKLTTKLDVNADYYLNGNKNPTSFNDIIESTVYFFTSENSFAPIYSVTSGKMSYVSVSRDNDALKAKAEQYEYGNSILYKSQEEYVINSTVDGKVQGAKTFEYDYKTLIDNAELLFALRSCGVPVEQSSNIPVVSASYGEKQTLLISNTSEGEKTYNIDVNGGGAQNYLFKIKTYSFCVAETNKSGKSHFLNIQKNNVDGVGDLNLMLSYAQPLSIYYDGIYTNFGALTFTLTEINIK